MKENETPRNELDAKGKQSAKKKMLMQEKKKRVEENTSKFSVQFRNPNSKKEKRALFYKNKYGYSTLLSELSNNSENIRIRKDALAGIPSETIQSYYEIIVSSVSKKNLILLKKIYRCPPILNLEDLTIRLRYPNQEECRKAIKGLNKEIILILKANNVTLPDPLKLDFIFFEVPNINGIILFEIHPYLKNPYRNETKFNINAEISHMLSTYPS